MNIRYSRLLSPLQIGDVLLKNRMMATAGIPHMLQGSEEYPTEKVITHLANRAKNGAAAVFLNFFMSNNGHGMPEAPGKGPKELFEVDMSFPTHDNTSKINISKISSHNYLCQLIDAVRYYESVAITMPFGSYTREVPQGASDVTGDMMQQMMRDRERERENPELQLIREKENCLGRPVGNITKKQIQEYIDTTVANAKVLRQFGFEMFSIHNSYHNSLASEFWSEKCNNRADEYGGSVKGRARLFLELYDALRQTFGKDFPLETLISAEGPGVNIRDTIELAKMSDGLVDIFHIRAGEKDPQHPVGFTSTRSNPCPNLNAAAALKSALNACGSKMLVGVSAGLQNPDFNEKILTDGKADIICMSRAFICDYEYGKKIYEGRGEDINPCIRCNKCHVPNDSDKFRSFCSINPMIGIETKFDKMVEQPAVTKKVAVIGGGPAGMKAAIVAAERGHNVVLYEKETILGGQLFHADYASFKWPLADFKNYLIRQLYKVGVKVQLATEANRELLLREGYDDVIVAIGPKFLRPSIPGADGPNTMLAIEAYGKEKQLPQNIVVIGGSETGTETGMYLAENGHKVTVMTRQSILSPDAAHAHYAVMQMEAYKALENFSYIKHVKDYVSIDESGITYLDKDGVQQRIECELVVLSGGVKPKVSEAAAFYGAAARTHYIGDCCREGDVHKAITAGFATANQI